MKCMSQRFAKQLASITARLMIFVCILGLADGCDGDDRRSDHSQEISSSYQAVGSVNEDSPSTKNSSASIMGPSLIEESFSSDSDNWLSTGSMAASRLQHTATLLSNGQILVTGGYTRSAELYDSTKGTWNYTSDALNTHRAATATLLQNDKVLVAGAGGAEWNSGISSEIYDPDTGIWTATGSLVTPRFYHTATLLPDGRVLVTGGSDAEYGGNVLATAEVYDPVTGLWTPTASMSVTRCNHTATILRNGNVLITGGTDAGGTAQNTAEVYDPTNGSWSPAGSMAFPRTYHSATLLPDGKVLAVGGGSFDWSSSASAELFDPDSGTWSPTGGMAKPRRSHSATLLPTGVVLVTGGFHEFTGIQKSAEVYNPAKGTWSPAGDMDADRYLHTATLLANGKLLVAGGFSNKDQASAELFNPYFHTVLETGSDWQLANISGVDEETGQPYNADVYSVQNVTGIDQAPLPTEIKQDLLESAEPDDAVFILSQSILNELNVSEQQGTLSPALQAIAEPLDPETGGISELGLFGKCKSKTVTKSKTYNINAPLSLSEAPGRGFSGTLALNGNIQGSGTGEVQLKRKRIRLFGFCVPYAVVFNHARASGNILLNYGATLSGTVSYANPESWEIRIAKPSLFHYDFFIGPIPVHIGFNLPITVGLDLKASVTGAVSYTGSENATGNFSYTCTLSGCWGASNFNQSSSRSPQMFVESVSGRIQPSLYEQAAVRAYLYSEWLAYAQIGVRPYLRGDLWGFYGSTCGDADGDGVNETVDALTFDLDLQVNVTAQVGAFGSERGRWNDLWHSSPYHLGFWDLRNSDALSPMLSGLSSVPANTLQQYRARMRTCWPYTDSVNYQLKWGDGVSTYLSGAPTSWVPVSHAWSQPGSMTLGLVALNDSHGRALNKTTVRNVQVTSRTGTWTPWRNRDSPSSTGDHETIADFNPRDVCNGATPLDIECQTVSGVDWRVAGEVYTCNTTIGGLCLNANQPDRRCLDYMVRFLCP